MYTYILLIFITFITLVYPKQIIFQSDNTNGSGDNLTSLYNAYLYSKKYDLDLHYEPFIYSELFEFSKVLKTNPTDNAHVVEVRSERDILTHLHKPNVKFKINVLTDRLAHDAATAQEARQLVAPTKTIDLDHVTFKKDDQFLFVTVHVRKGNNPDRYDGELNSTQLYDYDKNIVRYRYVNNFDSFAYFVLTPCNMGHYQLSSALDRYWPLKVPPEQYYVDQINHIAKIANKKIVIQIVTDTKNPLSLIDRFKKLIDDPSVLVEYHDNTHKDIKTRTMEDLYILSQGDIIIHAKSSFAFAADVIGDPAIMVLPQGHRWAGNMLIIDEVIIQSRKQNDYLNILKQ